MVRLDFETRSELDVRDVGAWIYAKHPTTEIISLAWAVDDGPVQTFSPIFDPETFQRMPKKIKWEERVELEKLVKNIRNSKLEAHNAFFEFCIWNITGVRQFGWPALPQNLFNCSAAKAARQAFPRKLEHLGRALKLQKQKDMEGHRVMLKLTSPRRATLADLFSKWHEDPEDFKKLFSYNRDDVLSEREASKYIDPLPPMEETIWRLNQQINMRGVMVDRDAIVAAIETANLLQKEFNAELATLTDGEVESVTQTKKMNEFLDARRETLPNLQRQTIEDALRDGIIKDPTCRRVLEIRQILGKSSVSKFETMLARMDPDDHRVRDIMMYHGASTGRESGQGVQLHNLPRGTISDPDTCIEILKTRNYELFKCLYEDPMGALSSCLRGMIIAPPGKIIRSVDYNAIELRVLFWLADCNIGLQYLREKKDLYKKQASSFYRCSEDAVDKTQRYIGKKIVLGCGYQMGGDKFHFTLLNEGVRDISLEQAFAAVKSYRETFPEVPKFWRRLEDAAHACVATKRPTRVGKIRFELKKKFLTATLPSGRELFYYEPRISEQTTKWGSKDSVHFWYQDSQTKQWMQGPIYGGLWAENVTQATARDLLMDATLRLQDKGFTPLFTVHDEINTEDDENFSSLKEMEEIILRAPEWASGLPLAVEGFECKRYRK